MFYNFSLNFHSSKLTCRRSCARSGALTALVWILVVIMAVGIPTCESNFRECYTKCFIFCVIEPSQSLCSCTTRCLKECIFSELTKLEASDNENSDNLGFCKLGCSFSACSAMSTILKPNGDKVEKCVGSCSTKCTNTYSLP